MPLRRTQRRDRPCSWVGAAFSLCAALLCFACLAPSAAAQDAVRESFVSAGNSKPIHLTADDIATWQDGDRRVFLMRGKVLVEQGLLNIRMSQAVIWVDETKKKSTGIYHVEVYGEQVSLDEGAKRRAGKVGQLQLATRGEVSIKAYNDAVLQKALPSEPLFLRGKAYLTGQDLGKLTAPMPASFPTSQPAKGPPTIQQTQGVAAAPVPTVVPVPPVQPPPALQPPPAIPSPLSPLRGSTEDGAQMKLNIRPRSSAEIKYRNYPLQDSGETAWVVTSGIILTVTDPKTNKVVIDIEADRLVFWTKGTGQEMLNNLRSPGGQTSRSMEFYLSGHVEIRNESKKETEIIRADEVYYDVGRNVAIALRANLEIREPKLPYPIHFRAEELVQLNAKLFQGKQTEVYSTILPSDPGLKIQVRECTIEEQEINPKTIFGQPFIDRTTGQPLQEKVHYFTGWNNVLRFEGVPIFWTPYAKAKVEDPLGPLEAVSVNYNNVLGFQIYTTWDMHELIGLQPPPGTRWRLFIDGMFDRGPALGTEYRWANGDFFGIPSKTEGIVKAYGIYDTGEDVIGGDRGRFAFTGPFTSVPIVHPDFRGRFLSRLNVQEMPQGFSLQAQLAAQSDRAFLEQFYQPEWDTGLNQETFVYLKQQQNIWAWTVLGEVNLRRWITETEWLPKAEGHVLGLSLFDMFTYNARASAGYGRLHPTEEPSFAYLPTDARTDTGRFDIWQEISLPFSAGPFRVVPYLVGDVAYYTEDLTGDDRARLYGGGGVRASIPFSSLYPDVHSDIFNLDSIYHKIVVSGNYYIAHSDTSYQTLPQLDRLNDDASDQALRDIFPRQSVFNPGNAAFLTTSRLFDPQMYAVRRLIDNRIDTLDSIDVLQLGVRQRWQTKRGPLGNQHAVDWMTLDLRASVFPHSNRDNFGELFGILEYDWIWNIGDRTALTSDGWFEPVEGGPRVFNIGAYIGRPDATVFYLGYRHIDPLESRSIIGAVTYAFSAKYAVTFSAGYDLGTEIQTSSFMVTRMGTDLQVSLGFNYNSILNTFGVQFEIVPNLFPLSRRAPGPGPGHFGGVASR